MTDKVLVTVLGKQKYDDLNDKIEMTTVGTIEENENGYTIRYTEEQEPPAKPNRATLKISKDEKSIELIRSGSASSCLIIEKSRRNLCNYSTPYGDMLMGIFGREINIGFDEDEGKRTFHFAYDIDINGALSSQNDVTVTLKNIEQEKTDVTNS